MEASAVFSDEDKAHAYLTVMRWPAGVQCPRCASAKVGYVKTRRVWDCYDCAKAAKAAKKVGGAKVKSQFSVKTGTLLEESKLKVGTWLVALWLIVNAKNGISSYEVARALGVTQKTGWFLSHRIREALRTGTFERQLSGIVEVDEKRVGGLATNMHHRQWAKKIRGSKYQGKALVIGLLERQGELRTEVIPSIKRDVLHKKVREHVKPRSTLYSDALHSYRGLEATYRRGVVDHAVKYVDGNIHVNSLENFWALFARCILGTHVCVEPAHLSRYVQEETWRFNARKVNDRARFVQAFTNIPGRRLDYKTLINGQIPEGCSTVHVKVEGSAADNFDRFA